MFTIPKPLSLASGLCLANLALSTNVAAVGGGIPFAVNEGLLPNAMANALNADSMDFTYHACTTVNFVTGNLEETGYFWISSYQDIDGVVDSQINDFQVNGYHIYGIYKFSADRVGIHPDFLQPRVDYIAESGSVRLFLDPDQNTQLALNPCQVSVLGNGSDRLIGGSVTLASGEKSEKVDIANGDFELRFSNWNWVNPPPIIPFVSDEFVFNANITQLNGPLLFNHFPEGSGNLYWIWD